MAESKKKNKAAYTVLKYSGMVMQMAVLFTIAIYLGKFLDNKMGNEKPYLMLLLLLISLIAYLYTLIKDLGSKKE